MDRSLSQSAAAMKKRASRAKRSQLQISKERIARLARERSLGANVQKQRQRLWRANHKQRQSANVILLSKNPPNSPSQHVTKATSSGSPPSQIIIAPKKANHKQHHSANVFQPPKKAPKPSFQHAAKASPPSNVINVPKQSPILSSHPPTNATSLIIPSYPPNDGDEVYFPSDNDSPPED